MNILYNIFIQQYFRLSKNINYDNIKLYKI